MTAPSRTALTPILRGLRGRCPACGKGRLFTGYLRQAPTCSHCGEPTGQIRAEDGPPWLTVLILGPLLAPLTFIVSMKVALPLWLSLSALGAFAIGAVLFLLPRIKGAFIGLLWRMQQTA
ncbi:MAG: DUF983 domain-containing protein [Alphaproteobacteria bacterium]|jgi:uncharacterized protein (DUF983 family)|nr:DUF983 domain-containing protein [Alphaproteobacteria bacterium]